MVVMEQLSFYWQYPFVRYALATGMLIALCSALLGVILVLKHLSFIGDSLSHVAFSATALAALLKISGFGVVLTVTIVTALILMQSKSERGDSSLAMISVASLAVGYLVLSKFAPSSNLAGDVCSTLFGTTSILTLEAQDVVVCCVLAVGVLLVFTLGYSRIFTLTLDEDFFRSLGKNPRVYNAIEAVVVATVVTLAMNLVGSLLITALIIFPAMTAMQITKSFKKTLVVAGGLGTVVAGVGILLAVLAATPVGATIVTMDLVVYLVVLVGKLIKRGGTL